MPGAKPMSRPLRYLFSILWHSVHGVAVNWVIPLRSHFSDVNVRIPDLSANHISLLTHAVRSHFHQFTPPPPRNLEAGRESVSPLTRENASILPTVLRRHQTIRNARDQDIPNRDRKGRAEVCCRASSWKGRQGWRLCYDSP